MKIEIEIPPACTMGDLTTVAGALLKASTEFVDWEAMYEGSPAPVSVPGVVILDIARQLEGASSK